MKLINYTAELICKGKIFSRIYQEQQKQVDLINDNIQDLINQCFIQTATWSLYIWEELYNIETDINDSYVNRRARVISAMRGQGTTTVEMIKNMASSYANGDVEVIEHNDKYYFVIKFVGTKGVPPKLEDLKNAINLIKPCHLGVEYEFTYNVWGDIKAKTWGDIKTMTWQEIKEFNNTRRA